MGISPMCWRFPDVAYLHTWRIDEQGSLWYSEPHPDAPILQPDEVDLILVPSVACDVRGYRLGYGGGYYDRLLSSSQWAHKPTIGIAFEFAISPELPIDEWDNPCMAFVQKRV
jgi:5-formyltetrahydrofolate cyclo-ligase